jgi:hypothetical protein
MMTTAQTSNREQFNPFVAESFTHAFGCDSSTFSSPGCAGSHPYAAPHYHWHSDPTVQHPVSRTKAVRTEIVVPGAPRHPRLLRGWTAFKSLMHLRNAHPAG